MPEEIEEWNIAGASHSIAAGERCTVMGHHSILVGKDLVTNDNYKLIAKYNYPVIGLPELNVDIEETMTEREYYLVSSALKAFMYFNDEQTRNLIP